MMQFTLDPKKLLEALDVVGIVAPRPIPPAGIVGYRFSVHDGLCHIYSRDGQRVAHVAIEATDADGPVDLILPASTATMFQYMLKATKVTFTSEVTGDQYVVKFISEHGDDYEGASTNPKLLATCDDDFAKATATAVTIPAGVLRLAFSTVKSYLPTKEDRAEDFYQTVQSFDASKPEWAKGDGVMFAANNVRASYFDCPVLKGKHIAVFQENLPFVISFLSKCEGDVEIRRGENMLFFKSGERILGITHNVKQHQRYSYYSLEKDGYVFKVDKDVMLNSLLYMRAALADKARDKIRFNYDHDNKCFNLTMSESSSRSKKAPVDIMEREFRDPKPFGVNVNINHLIELFAPSVCNVVEFRVCVVPSGNKEGALFRTVDKFWIDPTGKVATDNTQDGVVECKVTRFMPSKD
jgi:hypothetical protein